MTVLVAGIMISTPQKMKEQEELDRKNLQEVVVATRTIAEGERLSDGNVKASRIERSKVPLNSIESFNKALRMVARNSIKEGTTVSYADVVPAEEAKAKP